MRTALKVFLGLLIGLLLAEWMFRFRDDGAFPHLNFYTSDSKLGVRLEPNAAMRLRVADNPPANVHTNSAGFRGGEWNATSRTVVVGDSQVFGLGVEDEETFPALMGALNAGVPTYGPREYLATALEVKSKRPIDDVVLVMNMSNDMFEVDSPNKNRHAVWDGWAVRKETAPLYTSAFPLRGWLMSRSHMVFALRALAYRQEAEEQAFASEGTWTDLTKAAAEHPSSEPVATEAERLTERAQLSEQLRRIRGQIELEFAARASRNTGSFGEAAKELTHYKGNASDIVSNPYAEAARPVDLTAYNLLQAALSLERNDEALRKVAEKDKDKKFLALLDERKKLRARLQEVTGDVSLEVTPFDTFFAEAVKAVAPARLTVLVLPLDVQVSEEEWKKYGKPARDMAPTLSLNQMLVKSAQAAGAGAVDATAALKAAEPGAFLRGDLHMSKTGHAAVAALLKELPKPPPQQKSKVPKLPQGRSWPPTGDEWDQTPEVTVKGSSASNCETKMVREWFRVRCKPQYPEWKEDSPDEDPTIGGPSAILQPMTIELESGGHGDAYVFARDRLVIASFPFLQGDEVHARIGWRDHERRLVLKWAGGSKPEMAFGEKTALQKPNEAPRAGPSELLVDFRNGPVDQRCLDARKPKDSCALDLPTRDVACGEGEVAFGALRRCLRACSDEKPCTRGKCVAQACIVP